MINELYKLSAAMDEAGIRTQSWHRKYKPIPNIRATAPCVRLVLAEGVITDFSEVSADLGAGLRKYGSNQGSYPCMNLAPLYRVTEEPIKKQLASLRPEKLTAEKLQELKSWCSVDNWNRKFLGKYKISMVNTSVELRAAAAEYEPLRILIEQSNLLADPAAFRQALETAVWKKLGRGEDTELALRILFYQGKANQAAEDDYGSLSVALEAEKLIDAGKPTVNNEPEKFLQSEFVRKYWDARVFGNTFLEDGGNKGFIKTGIVQFSMGLSLAPVDILRQTNTNEAGVQEGKNAGMAPLAYRIVEHGVYCMPFFVNPNYAQKSGCTAEDIELLKLLIPHAYELNRSAIRPDVRIRHAWYLEHKSLLGSCPDYQLLEALTPEKLGDRNEPSSSWADYQDKTQLPETLRARMASCVDLINP